MNNQNSRPVNLKKNSVFSAFSVGNPIKGWALACLFLLPFLSAPAPADEAQEQAAEFRRLRQIHGHFQGGKEWIPDVDTWGGKKHDVMRYLQQLLGAPGTSEERIVELMGEPDERAGPASRSWVSLVRPKEGDLLLIYQWRGSHDFLYFLMKSKQTVKAGWWMAGE